LLELELESLLGRGGLGAGTYVEDADGVDGVDDWMDGCTRHVSEALTSHCTPRPV